MDLDEKKLWYVSTATLRNSNHPFLCFITPTEPSAASLMLRSRAVAFYTISAI